MSSPNWALYDLLALERFTFSLGSHLSYRRLRPRNNPNLNLARATCPTNAQLSDRGRTVRPRSSICTLAGQVALNFEHATHGLESRHELMIEHESLGAPSSLLDYARVCWVSSMGPPTAHFSHCGTSDPHAGRLPRCGSGQRGSDAHKPSLGPRPATVSVCALAAAGHWHDAGSWTSPSTHLQCAAQCGSASASAVSERNPW